MYVKKLLIILILISIIMIGKPIFAVESIDDFLEEELPVRRNTTNNKRSYNRCR